MKSLDIKNKAEELRRAGYSYNMIAERVSVSKSTLYTWLAKIPYQPNDEVKKRIGDARSRSGEVKHQLKLESYRQAKIMASSDIKRVSTRDRYMFGLALYLGEGEKNDTVGVINADPYIIVFMVEWLGEFYGVQKENLTLAIHLYPDNNSAACLSFWSKLTGIPQNQFGKTQIDKRFDKKLGKRGKLPYGTAHLRVKSNGNKQLGVLLSRRIQASTDALLGK